jgi:hypothetical protein
MPDRYEGERGSKDGAHERRREGLLAAGVRA